MTEPRPQIPPAAWARLFADTLVRLYPKTAPELAALIAHGQYRVEGKQDPVFAAELYALSEGPPDWSSA